MLAMVCGCLIITMGVGMPDFRDLNAKLDALVEVIRATQPPSTLVGSSSGNEYEQVVKNVLEIDVRGVFSSDAGTSTAEEIFGKFKPCIEHSIQLANAVESSLPRASGSPGGGVSAQNPQLAKLRKLPEELAKKMREIENSNRGLARKR